MLVETIINEMQNSYDNGLREYQEAIYTGIYLICVGDKKQLDEHETTSTVLYLKDLARRLKQLEKALLKGAA